MNLQLVEDKNWCL